MNNWPESIARKAIVKFKAYGARGGAGNALHLDANESPWAPPPVTTTDEFNRYPEQQPADLRDRLASLYGVSPTQIMMGRGADEAIEILLRTFCEAGEDSVLTCPPTFGYYETCANVQGAKTVKAPLHKDYTYDADLIKSKMTQEGASLKIAFLCSPNNPTGNAISTQIITELCAAYPRTLIVVDEAYAEFSDQDSFAREIDKHPNLVILRTLSKAYSLAGVRMGVAVADPRIINLMLKVLPPYPIARPVERVVMRALSSASMPVHAARIELWKSERKRMYQTLKASPYIKHVYPSEANFLMLDVVQETQLLETLAKFQIKIRDFRSIGRGKFRISIGSPEENDIALAALEIAVPVIRSERIGEKYRKTKETDIAARVNLDNPSIVNINTGIGFYDHMLEALAKHGRFGLVLSCHGDLEIDTHHTIEDCALALGAALANALCDKSGAGRFGFVMPMDETQARVAVDLSGRPATTFRGKFPTDHAGEFPAEMCAHFFESLSQTLKASIQVAVEGENTHHMIESCFKGLGRALAPAFERTGNEIASTKGVL